MIVLVGVLGVGGVETDRQAEGRSFRVRFQEVERAVAAQVGDVARRPVGQRLAVGRARERREDVEHRVERRAVTLDTDPDLADETRAIPGRPEQERIALVAHLPREGRRSEGVPVRALDEAGQQGSAARRAHARRDERVLEPRALGRVPVEVRSVHDRVSGASEDVGAVVVRDEHQHVRWRGSSERRRHEGAAQESESENRRKKGAHGGSSFEPSPSVRKAYPIVSRRGRPQKPVS